VDLAIASEPTSSPGTGAQLVVLPGNGDGTFHNAFSYTPGDSFSIAVGDFNGDRIPDIVTSYESTFNGPPGVVRVFLGKATEISGPPLRIPDR
jgi:hypothetical protein